MYESGDLSRDIGDGVQDFHDKSLFSFSSYPANSRNRSSLKAGVIEASVELSSDNTSYQHLNAIGDLPEGLVLRKERAILSVLFLVRMDIRM